MINYLVYISFVLKRTVLVDEPFVGDGLLTVKRSIWNIGPFVNAMNFDILRSI